MEDKNINDILGIDDSKRQSNNENMNSERASILVSKNKNESFANGLNTIGVILYIIGVVAAIYLFTQFSKSGWSGKFDEDKVPTALLISGFVLFYHIVFGLICQGISKVLQNMKF